MYKKKGHGIISNNLFALSWQFRVSPIYTIYQVAMQIITDVIFLFEHAFLPAYLISCFENGSSFEDVLKFLIPMVLAIFIFIFLLPNYVSAYFRPKADEKVKRDIRLALSKKAAEIELAKYDDPDFYNDFVWAMQQAPEHFAGALYTFKELLGTIAVTILSGAYIVSIDPVGLIVVLIVVICLLFIRMFTNKRYVKRDEDLLPTMRKRDYTNRVFYIIDHVKDLKLSRMGEKLFSDYDQTAKEEKEITIKHGKVIAFLETLDGIVRSILVDGLYYSYLFFKVLVQKAFGLGTLFGLYKSTEKLRENLYTFVQSFPEFQKHSLYIEKMRVFLESENTLADNGRLPVPKSGTLSLSHVSFAYPGNEALTLDDITMTIKHGEKIAIVGYNGAGKSTLIKLLLRLYDPTSGEIRYGNRKLHEYPLSEYRKLFGAVFQDFELIAATLGENITMSDKPLDLGIARDVIRRVDFTERMKKMPDGFDTQLTREFDDAGIILSGGEMQKLALARVLYADAAVMILDEPSSALDPIAEYRLNQEILKLASDKTVLMISHRLSTTRFADKIYMLENGKIIEYGAHEELLELGGKYAEMFTVQAEKYR